MLGLIMAVSVRSCLTAGIAMLGASAIAIAPIEDATAAHTDSRQPSSGSRR